MEGAVTPVLSIIYDRMRNLEIGGGIIEGVQLVPNDILYP